MPWSSLYFFEDAVFLGAKASGVALAAGTDGGTVAVGRDSGASACTVRVERVIISAASATDEVPANSQKRSEVFVFVLLEIRRLTICSFY